MDEHRVLKWRWCTLGVLAVPSVVMATDMPPIELLFVPPIFISAVISVAGWFLFGFFTSDTARAFSRMLLLAILWTPVPVMDSGTSLPVLPSAIYWWFSPSLGNDGSRTVVIATSVVAVLGAALLVIRGGWRLYCESPRG